MEALRRDAEETKKHLNIASNKLSNNQAILKDKEARLSMVTSEKKKIMEEALEMRYVQGKN